MSAHLPADYVPAGPVPSSAALTARRQRKLERARRLARLMDAQWGIGRLRFGAETLVDLVPGVGGAVSAAVLVYQLALARQLGLPRAQRLRMLGNVAADLIIGLVPVLGDAADTVFKAHLRNQQILDAHVHGREGAPPTPYASRRPARAWSLHPRQ